MKTLMMLSAVPASGKSTWAKNYANCHDNVRIVSSDDIRSEITHSFTDHTKEKEVWATFDERIKEYAKIENVTTILDALNDMNWLRQKYVKEHPEYDRYVLVIFAINKENSAYYNQQRGKDHIVPPEALERLFNKFEPVDEETKKYFDEIYYVDWLNKKEERIK